MSLYDIRESIRKVRKQVEALQQTLVHLHREVDELEDLDVVLRITGQTPAVASQEGHFTKEGDHAV